MKTILLHGDDELKSYERLQKFIETAKSRSWEVVYLDDTNLSFLEAIRSRTLFGGEDFFILRDIKKIGKRESEWLNKNSSKAEGNLIIYHPGVASATFIKSFPDSVKVEEFKLPKLIFQFLDSFVPKNAKSSINLLHQIAVNQAPEFIFSLLARHIRDLYWVSVEAKTLPYPDWRVGKLREQAKKFSINQIAQLINKLSEIDVEVKTSNVEVIPSLDLLLATKLEY